MGVRKLLGIVYSGSELILQMDLHSNYITVYFDIRGIGGSEQA